MPAFSLVCTPHPVTLMLHHTHDAPLPTHTPGGHVLKYTCECHSFGGLLEPRYIVGAESLDQ